MQGHVARLFSLASNLQMLHSAEFMLKVSDGEFAELFAPKAVIEQDCKNGTIPDAFERFSGRGHEELPGLMIGNRWGLATFEDLSRRN